MVQVILRRYWPMQPRQAIGRAGAAKRRCRAQGSSCSGSSFAADGDEHTFVVGIVVVEQGRLAAGVDTFGPVAAVAVAAVRTPIVHKDS